MRFRVIWIGLIAVFLGLFLWQLRDASAGAARTPVLVELFTSEGCSDCPPADVLLEKLDRSQPVAAADVVVLSEHVDYWDGIGWRDPYSSREFSVRQGDYAHRFRLPSPYTPEMVVDGEAEFVGSDERRALQAIAGAAKAAKIPVSVSSIHRAGEGALTLHIEVGQAPYAMKPIAGQVWIALADDSDQSSVRGGENAGRVLRHVAVVRSLTQVGTIDRSGTFSKDVTLQMEKDPQNLRVVAIVQETTAGRILGLATARLPN